MIYKSIIESIQKTKKEPEYCLAVKDFRYRFYPVSDLWEMDNKSLFLERLDNYFFGSKEELENIVNDDFARIKLIGF